jgi:hypothetical protein
MRAKGGRRRLRYQSDVSGKWLTLTLSAPDFVLPAGACQARLARKDKQITAVSLNLITPCTLVCRGHSVARQNALAFRKVSHSPHPRLIGSNLRPQRRRYWRWSQPIGSSPRQGQESLPTSPHTPRYLGQHPPATSCKKGQTYSTSQAYQIANCDEGPTSGVGAAGSTKTPSST